VLVNAKESAQKAMLTEHGFFVGMGQNR